MLPDSEAETDVGTFIRVIIKRLAPVGGIQTFQQVEMVLNPLVLNVQVSFIKAIVAFFGDKKNKKRKKNAIADEDSAAASYSEPTDVSTASAELEHEENFQQMETRA